MSKPLSRRSRDFFAGIPHSVASSGVRPGNPADRREGPKETRRIEPQKTKEDERKETGKRTGSASSFSRFFAFLSAKVILVAAEGRAGFSVFFRPLPSVLRTLRAGLIRRWRISALILIFV
jgi:hypothetical protein